MDFIMDGIYWLSDNPIVTGIIVLGTMITIGTLRGTLFIKADRR